jgi:hypothetical protein
LGKRSELWKSERWKPKRTSKKFQSIRTSKVFKKVMRTSKLIDSVQNRFKSDLIDYWIKVFKIDVKKIYFRRFLFGVTNCPVWSKSEMQWSKQKWNFTIEKKIVEIVCSIKWEIGIETNMIFVFYLMPFLLHLRPNFHLFSKRRKNANISILTH